MEDLLPWKKICKLDRNVSNTHRNHLHVSSIAGKFPLKVRKEVLQGSPLKQTAEAIFVFSASIIESSLNFLTLKVIRISICHSVYSKIRHSRKRHDFSLGIFETEHQSLFLSIARE